MFVHDASPGAVYQRCGCRDERGRQLGARCPRLGELGHGTWSFAVRVDALAGRQRVRRGGFATQAHARAALAEYRARSRRSAAAGAWTTGRWLDAWLRGHRSIRPSTARSYAGHVRLYLTPILGRIPLDELDAQDVQAMIDKIIADHVRDQKPISAASLTRIRATLRCALRAAMRRGLISTNPATLVQLPPHVRPHPVVWTPSRIATWKATGERPVVSVWTAEQLNAFLTFTARRPLHLMWRLIAMSGLRRGEACGLRWADIDLDAAQFTVAQQLVEVGGTVTTAAPKTAASRRTMPLDAVTLAMLRALHEAQAAGAVPGCVFTDPRGRPLRPGRVTHAFRAQVTASGLPPVRLHDLRHGAATLALAAGVDLKTVQDLLGHSTIVTTADIYTSVLPQVRRAAVDSIADLVLRAKPAA